MRRATQHQKDPGGMREVFKYPEPQKLRRGLEAYQRADFLNALAIFRQLDAVHENHHPARFYGAATHWARTSSDAAFVEQVMRETCAAMPKWVVPHYNLGNFLEYQGRPDEAERWIRKALKLLPNDHASWNTLGNIRLAQGRAREAASCYERSIATAPPNDGVARWNMAFAFGYLGKWAEMWAMYEYRWLNYGHLPDHGLPIPTPPWDGVSPVRHLITSDEQGIGDTLQFVRFLPTLRAYCERLTCVVRFPELVPLLTHNFPDVEFLAREASLPQADAHVPLLSCVSRLQLSEDQIDGGRYLAEPDVRLPLVIDERPVVGLNWAGNATHKRDGTRSMTFEQMAPLLDLPGIQFVNLTFNGRGDVTHPNLLDLRHACPDFAASAALVAALDAVVTVDTSTLHLAGALGVPVYACIAAAPDFRWMLDRTDTPWYDSVTLVRQPPLGDWASVIREVKARIGAGIFSGTGALHD